jgi:ribose-phosphate pyrophosphokinase
MRTRPITRIHVFPDTLLLGRSLARALGVGASTVVLHRFPDGESLVRTRLPAGHHAILVRSLHDPNARLLETVLAADGLRRAGAARVTLVAPYLPYMRQDRVFVPGQPISQRVIGAWLGQSFDAVVTVEPHLHRIRRLAEVMPTRAEAVSAAPAIAGWLRREGRAVLLVGPDEESLPWVRAIAALAGCPFVVGRKRRLGDHAVRIELPPIPAAARAVLIDDIASSGQTLAEAARALRGRGVRIVDAVVVHAIFAPGAVTRLRRARIRQIVSCDTIPHATNGIRITPVLAPVVDRLVARPPGLGGTARTGRRER